MTTEHDTVNKQMIHGFGNEIQLITDWRTKKAYLMNNGETKDTTDISEMTVVDYMEMVFNIEKSINK